MSAKTVVLFASSFRREGSPNIDHITLDGVQTLCGRTGWATDEGWDARLDDPTTLPLVGCKKCSLGYAKSMLDEARRVVDTLTADKSIASGDARWLAALAAEAKARKTIESMRAFLGGTQHPILKETSS